MVLAGRLQSVCWGVILQYFCCPSARVGRNNKTTNIVEFNPVPVLNHVFIFNHAAILNPWAAVKLSGKHNMEFNTVITRKLWNRKTTFRLKLCRGLGKFCNSKKILRFKQTYFTLLYYITSFIVTYIIPPPSLITL